MALGNPITQTRNPGGLGAALAKVGVPQAPAPVVNPVAKNIKPGGKKRVAGRSKAPAAVTARNNPRGGMGVSGMNY
jgi:hypothetical protein